MKTTVSQSLYQVVGKINMLKNTFDELNELGALRSLELHVKDVK